MNTSTEKKEYYPDGVTEKTFHPDNPSLNKFGFDHATKRCQECGQWECDFNGVGHYRG